ncbi:MAG TPA: hypothetical protein VHA56_01365 [Mucilaginibacter sp.]|nr:hypothetical protein [Mucilaginibacter sp.]
MAFKFIKHKWQKITLAIASVFLLLILLLALFVNSYWSPILESKVKDIVSNSSDGLYQVDFSSAKLHVLRGTIVIFNISLKPDTAVYNAKRKKGLAPNNLVELHIKKLVLSHIHPLSLYFKHTLKIGQVLLYAPELNVSYQLNHTRDTVVKDRRTAWQKISKTLHYIHIGDILMGDVKFRYKDYSGNKLAASQFEQMNISAHDLLIDSATQTDRSRLLYCKDITAELNNYKGKTTNGLYSYTINSLKLSTSTSQLNIAGLALKPVNTDEFFNRSHKDRFTLSLDSVQLNHFDFLSYHKYRTLTASDMTIKNGHLQVFANPNHLKKNEDKVKSFPNEAMRNLPLDLRIDTVNLSGIDVTYNEYNLKTKKTGTLAFNNTDGRVLNLTNNKTALSKNNIISIKLGSSFMNRGKLEASVKFNMTDKNDSFSFAGSLGTMDLEDINEAAMPLGMFKVTSGTLKKFEFDIQADRYGSKGRIGLLYNDLKVTLLKPDTDMDRLKRKTIASLFTNIFILKHNNPDKDGGTPRIAYIRFTRKPENAFFKTIWQSLLSGIKPSVGLDKKTEQSVAELQTRQAINKQNRKERKERRKKKREQEQAQKKQ